MLPDQFIFMIEEKPPLTGFRYCQHWLTLPNVPSLFLLWPRLTASRPIMPLTAICLPAAKSGYR